MGTHLKLHATELKQMTQTQTHPLHYFNAHLDPQINKITFKCKKIYRILLGAGASKNFDYSSSGFSPHHMKSWLRTPQKFASSMARGFESGSLAQVISRFFKHIFVYNF